MTTTFSFPQDAINRVTIEGWVTTQVTTAPIGHIAVFQFEHGRQDFDVVAYLLQERRWTKYAWTTAADNHVKQLRQMHPVAERQTRVMAGVLMNGELIPAIDDEDFSHVEVAA